MIDENLALFIGAVVSFILFFIALVMLIKIRKTVRILNRHVENLETKLDSSNQLRAMVNQLKRIATTLEKK